MRSGSSCRGSGQLSGRRRASSRWSPACSGARVLGGFDSILGAIVGGLIVGASEKLAEVYIGEYFGGGIEGWFAYVVALAFLLIRPSGLFGQKLVERV